MKKTLVIASLLTATLTAPAFAKDPTISANTALTGYLASQANAHQVRKLLASKNYKNISVLNLDENGRWSGTAVKDGKTVLVSVYLPQKLPAAATN